MQVAAACLYIVCRQDEKPYMLIDFSDHLSINVFALGAVYLQVRDVGGHEHIAEQVLLGHYSALKQNML